MLSIDHNRYIPVIDEDVVVCSANDISKLSFDFSKGALSEKSGFNITDLDKLREYYLKHYSDNEYVYYVFASCYMERKLWKMARLDLYCRLYIVDFNSCEYEQTINMLTLVEENIVNEIVQIPLSYKHKLFSRDLNYLQGNWESMMNYTDHLKYQAYEKLETIDKTTVISKVKLLPGDLILRSRPLSVAPWSFESYDLNIGDPNIMNSCRTCFHCLSVMDDSIGLSNRKNMYIACPVFPYECRRTFCSEECFLNNAAVHYEECLHIPKLSLFSKTALNDTIVLLVVRTLIRLRLYDCSDAKTFDNEGNMQPDLNSGSILNSILNIKIDYDIIKEKYGNILNDIEIFAYFLLSDIGPDFCLHLNFGELTHLIVVLWIKCVPFISEMNYHVQYFGNILGGTFFSLETNDFQLSSNPNCVLNFGSNGKISIRSIYEIDVGASLSINTLLDKYLPGAFQTDQFWSVPFLISHNRDDSNAYKSLNELYSIRCKNCINSFSSPFNLVNSEILDIDYLYCMQNVHNWACINCNSLSSTYQNILQNRAHLIILKAQRLYNEGKYLISKGILENFIRRWSGILHPNHYLLYNANILLAGFLLKIGGTNSLAALTYLRRAIVMSDRFLPIVCHERAYLYSKLSEVMFKVCSTLSIKPGFKYFFKKITLESAYISLWNWIILSGCNSKESLFAMRRCRILAFKLSVHTPPICTSFTINFPSRYVEVFKAASGNSISTKSLINEFSKDFSFDNTELTTIEDKDIYGLGDVISVAFVAAQNGKCIKSIISVSTSIESYGIPHHGTGLNVIGIAASNRNVNFINELLKSILHRIDDHLNIIFKPNSSLDSIVSSEESIINLFFSVVYANELGVTPLIAMSSTYNDESMYPLDVEHKSIGGKLMFDVENEVMIVKLIIEHIDQCNAKLRAYKDKFRHYSCDKLNLISNGGVDLLSLFLNGMTHHSLNCQTALHYAAVRGKNDLVRYLARSGCDINRMNLEGATPLHLASLNGHYDVVNTLLSFGANINTTLITGETPLHLAVNSLHKPTIDILVSYYRDNKDVDSNIEGGKIYRKFGPSIWHALVVGITKNQDILGKYSESKSFNLDELLNRLIKAINICQIMTKSMNMHSIFNIYAWSNILPSQILWDYWVQLIEKYPYRDAWNNLNASYASKDVEDLTNNIGKANENIKKCAVLRSYNFNKYKDNNCEEIITDSSEKLFTSIRALQFLMQVLRSMEGSHQYSGVQTF